jgi:hypothetical protein
MKDGRKDPLSVLVEKVMRMDIGMGGLIPSNPNSQVWDPSLF